MISLKKRVYNSPSFINFPLKDVNLKTFQIAGLSGSLRSFFVSYLYEKLDEPIVFIAPNTESGEKLFEDIQQIISKDTIQFIPKIETTPYEEKSPNPSLIKLKIDALQNVIEKNISVTIISALALMEKISSPESFIDNQIFLEKGRAFPFNSIVDLLVSSGFERTDVVEDVGQFSIRGGIVDIYTWNYTEPIRLEFYGDTLESARFFDIVSQRSINHIESVKIIPRITKGQNKSSILSYLNSNAVFIVEEKNEILNRLKSYNDLIQDTFRSIKDQGIETEEPFTKYVNSDQIRSFLNDKNLIRIDFIKESGLEFYQFNSMPPPTFAAQIKRFTSYIKKQEQQNNDIFIQCDSDLQRDRLIEILNEEDQNYKAIVLTGPLHNGFILNDAQLHVLTEHEIFDRFKRKKLYKRFKNGEYLRSLKALTLKDYVVHIDYGIGKYAGISIIESNGNKKECITIEFAEGDKLFVSVDRLNRVQKYKSDGDADIKLTKLGSGNWEKLKNKAKKSVELIAAELLQLYAQRKSKEGYAFATDTHWQKELEASFPFEETEDQAKSIIEVKADLEKQSPMDRLLCGDVGYGKTEVALRAAFKAVNDGKQVAILVPTTILAYQHYQTFKERLSDFPLNVEMFSRFRSKSKQKESLMKLEKGLLDIIIGTHRLLSEDVKFKDLGLLIIDEEQRFGVRHKEKIKKIKVTVDVLTMTATPLPPTMHMSLMGSRDISHIETPPSNRLPVNTEIHEWNDGFIQKAIQRELDRSGQVYFVHNRVKTIIGIKDMLESILPHARIAVAHGQLPENQLEKIMMDFIHKKYDILVSTMIIENGLDIPNVNTIIIDHADKFGLAQLYQLRGRVGRSDKQAYAYLVIRNYGRLSELAKRRLRAIQDFTELGSGFKLALRDLEIRGAGNILGKEQSGYIQSIGFDLYCKILDETVSKLKSEKNLKSPNIQEIQITDTKIDTDFDLLIPKDYIFSDTERVSIYHRLVNFNSKEQIDKLRFELEDRFGAMPFEVEQLFETIELKVLAGKINASHLILKHDKIKMYFSEEVQRIDSFYNEIIPKLMKETRTKVQFINRPDKLGVEMKMVGKNQIEKLTFAKNLLKSIK